MLSMIKQNVTKGYAVLAALYSFSLVASNLMAGKLASFNGAVLPAAVVVYPVVYILSDLMTEVYGMRLSMLAIKLNAVCCALLAVLMTVTVSLPFPDFWEGQEAYAAVFSTAPRIVAASLIAYYLGDWLNSAVLSVMKSHMPQGGFPLRAVMSTAVGQIADTGVFIGIAFAGQMPVQALAGMMAAQYMFKVGYEIACIPVTARIVRRWKIWDGVNQFDKGDLITLYKPI